MNEYRLEVVETPRQIREFLDFPRKIYAGNRYWVHPLDSDIESKFDPARNALFEDGEAVRWLARNSRGQLVGRIAAFYNRDVAALNEQPTGGCGFFECIDDQKVANLMFDSCKEWLAKRGMEAMDGPINFGDRDQWWGLLVDGFELQPLYTTSYNPPYYKQLFENYGFQNYFNQHTYLRNLKAGQFPEVVRNRVKRLEETPGYRFEHAKKSNASQIADDFCMIYNKAWAKFPGVKPMSREHTQSLIKKLLPIMDEKLIYFAYFNDEPIGFFIMIPDINRVIGPFKGTMNWINGLRLLFMMKFSRKNDRVIGLTFGVTPEFQGRGVESGMMYAFERRVAAKEVPYKTLELEWIGDFNPVMMRVAENYVCATKHKLHTTYRYLFDREKPFTRCPRLGGAKRPG